MMLQFPVCPYPLSLLPISPPLQWPLLQLTKPSAAVLNCLTNFSYYSYTFLSGRGIFLFIWHGPLLYNWSRPLLITLDLAPPIIPCLTCYTTSPSQVGLYSAYELVQGSFILNRKPFLVLPTLPTHWLPCLLNLFCKSPFSLELTEIGFLPPPLHWTILLQSKVKSK